MVCYNFFFSGENIQNRYHIQKYLIFILFTIYLIFF